MQILDLHVRDTYQKNMEETTWFDLSYTQPWNSLIRQYIYVLLAIHARENRAGKTYIALRNNDCKSLQQRL